MVDSITDEMIADIRAQLATAATIVSEELTTSKSSGAIRGIRFAIGPKLGVVSRAKLDVESALIRKYCNAPYSMYSDNGTYYFRLYCN